MLANAHDMNTRVKDYIDSRGVCRKIVAKKIGMSESGLSLLLNGHRKMSIDDYIDICHAMAVDPRDLLPPDPPKTA